MAMVLGRDGGRRCKGEKEEGNEALHGDSQMTRAVSAGLIPLEPLWAFCAPAALISYTVYCRLRRDKAGAWAMYGFVRASRTRSEPL